MSMVWLLRISPYRRIVSDFDGPESCQWTYPNQT